MARRPLLPYPLAGSDARPEGPSREQPAESADRRTRMPLLIAVLAAVTVVALLAAVAWLTVRHSADRAAIERLTQERDQAAISAELYRSALESANVAEDDYRRAHSIEMVVASSAVARFLQQYQDSGTPPGAGEFVRAFFGWDWDVRSTAWLPIRGQSSPGRVLARVDRAASPEVVWVSRRSSATADPSVPARTNCLRLDVSALATSAAAGRAFDSQDRTPALLRWQDTYTFVPDAFCGVISAE